MTIISKILRRLSLLRFLLQLYSEKFFCRQVDILFICSASDKNIVVDQKKESRFLHPIKNDLSNKGFLVQQALWSNEPEASASNLTEELDVSLRSLYVSYILSYLFLRFICSPKVIVAIDMKYRFYVAARRMNIKVVEPLHGFNISQNHDRLSTEAKIKCCPDAFLAYDDLSAHTLMENRYRTFQVHRVRHPSAEILSFNNHIETTRTKIIMFTMAWGYDGEYTPYDGIIDNGIIHSEVIETIKARTDIFWIIRLHPVQLISKKRHTIIKFLKEQFENNNHVDFTRYNTFDIVQLFNHCDIHMTMRSSATAEAALVNCPTITLCPSISKNGDATIITFKKLIEAGLVTHTSLTKQTISEEIDQVLSSFNRSSNARQDFITSERGHDKPSSVITRYLN